MVQKNIPISHFHMTKVGNWTFCYENVHGWGKNVLSIYCYLMTEKGGLKH